MQDQTFNLVVAHQLIDSVNWIDCLRCLHRTAVRLDKLATAPYAPLIRSWKVATFEDPWTRDIGPHRTRDIDRLYLTRDRVMTMFCGTLRMYENLSSLHLSLVTIDTSFRESLAALPRLEHLQLCDCAIVVKEGSLPLKSLTMTPQDADDPDNLQLASAASLRSLDAGNHIARLIGGFRSENLEKLVRLSVMDVWDVDTLFLFLKQCPRLESLSIHTSVHQSQLKLSPVLPSTVPLLCTLTAPAQLHQLLTPDHPVRAARVWGKGVEGKDYMLRTCVVIARSSVPLHSLALPPTYPTLEFLSAIGSLLPELKEFSMEVLSRPVSEHSRTFMYRSLQSPSLPWRLAQPDDPWAVDLDDNAVFDDLPVEEISDDEGGVLPAITNMHRASAGPLAWETSTDRCRKILGWLFTGALILLSTLEALRLEVPQISASYEELNFAEQTQAIGMLSEMYPRLREVQFWTHDGRWSWRDNVWVSEGKSSALPFSAGPSPPDRVIVLNDPTIYLMPDANLSVLSDDLPRQFR
ncbi:hypothetical protein B0H19DRAFT_1066922 [Mycena capillaripes]|nr:hypothetical protein B0H19DRAFT_1066922 [Mycena capillaripes]